MIILMDDLLGLPVENSNFGTVHMAANGRTAHAPETVQETGVQSASLLLQWVQQLSSPLDW